LGVASRDALAGLQERPFAFRNGDINGDGQLDVSDVVRLAGFLFLGDAPPAHVGAIPHSGQRRCFDEEGMGISCGSRVYPGQEGDQAGIGRPTIEGRYAYEDDGTTIDLATGLTFGPSEHGTWAELLRFCDGLEYAGHDDWRLPDAMEALATRQRFIAVCQDACETRVVGPGSGWLSTSSENDPSKALMDFGGLFFSRPKGLDGVGVCVRGPD
jgi:hypothetical protein